jgi:hypothetical protein
MLVVKMTSKRQARVFHVSGIEKYKSKKSFKKFIKAAPASTVHLGEPCIVTIQYMLSGKLYTIDAG